MDLRDAEARVGLEEEAAVADGQVVLLPVPQVLQLLVLEGHEGVQAARQREGTRVRWTERQTERRERQDEEGHWVGQTDREVGGQVVGVRKLRTDQAYFSPL